MGTPTRVAYRKPHDMEPALHAEQGRQLAGQGFCLIPAVIPADRLDGLRHTYEELLARQRQIWAGELDWAEPTMAIKVKQPRLVVNALVDADTAEAVEFVLGETTLGVSVPPHPAACVVFTVFTAPVKLL